MKKEMSIYVHIPFCESKCYYCAFTSFCATNSQKEQYIDTLCKEITERKCDAKIKTIYIGGGTPSCLTKTQIAKIIDTIKTNFDLSQLQEFTIEMNPNSITEGLLKAYKELGVNRISIGVQSLRNRSLKKIGRLHTAKEALNKIKLAKRYFENISADLIIGIEGQTARRVCADAKRLLQVGVKHISCYLLEIYENTHLCKQIVDGKYTPLNEDDTITVFDKLAMMLNKNNLNRYEISNFAYKGYESKHNLNYWRRGEYLGFGMSAHSFVDNKRIKNSDNFNHYQNLEQDIENLTNKDIVEELIMLGLRCELGVNLADLEQFGFDLQKHMIFQQYIKQGFLMVDKNNDKIVKLNPKYYHISNTIICNLLPD